MAQDLTTIILTYNEEKHIERAIRSAAPVSSRIIIVDSFSSDRTLEIAVSLGAEVFQNQFLNQAQQFDWATHNIDLRSAWILRIDADEYLEPTLQQSLSDLLSDPGDVNAVYLRRKIVFLGREIRHGFFYPLLVLRLYRTGQGRMEQRWMDEHIVVDHPVPRTLNGDLVDENLNSLAWWTSKHIDYARREAYEIIAARHRNGKHAALKVNGPAGLRRFLKERIYLPMPSGLRSGLYYLYRYILGCGFLDGKAGFFFHFLQAFWYRTYVDANVFEIERRAAAQGVTAYELLRSEGIFD